MPKRASASTSFGFFDATNLNSSAASAYLPSARYMPPRLKCAVGSSGFCRTSFCKLASEISSAPGGSGADSAAGVAAGPDELAAESLLLSDLHEAKEMETRTARGRSRRFIGFIYEGGGDVKPRH